MDKLLNLMCMIFLHFFADFFLQGVLANMKQREWWEKQIEGCGSSIYRNDYKAALIAHSFQWSFAVMLPLFYEIYYVCYNFEYCSVLAAGSYIVLLALNTFVHYKIDDAKANRRSISLVVDQSLHLIQVFATWLIFIIATWKLFLFR